MRDECCLKMSEAIYISCSVGYFCLLISLACGVLLRSLEYTIHDRELKDTKRKLDDVS